VGFSVIIPARYESVRLPGKPLLEISGKPLIQYTYECAVKSDAENIIIKQGSQEVSNVKMIEELVDMLMVSRLYEANMKFIAARKEIASSITSAAMA